MYFLCHRSRDELIQRNRVCARELCGCLPERIRKNCLLGGLRNPSARSGSMKPVLHTLRLAPSYDGNRWTRSLRQIANSLGGRYQESDLRRRVVWSRHAFYARARPCDPRSSHPQPAIDDQKHVSNRERGSTETPEGRDVPSHRGIALRHVVSPPSNPSCTV